MSLQMKFTVDACVTFPEMEKSPKNLGDGKCSRTGLYAPSVGESDARSVREMYK